MTYHEGERLVQERAGWFRDDWGSAGVTPEIPEVGAQFLRRQRMLIIGAVDQRTAPWATALTGPAGFVEVTGERAIVVNRLPARDDPLAAALDEAEVGMLAIEPQTRRRMRVNGRARRHDAGFEVRTEQVYSNCPKYIQTRSLASERGEHPPAGRARTSKALTPEQQLWIRTADTFFIATYAPGHGADVSHRGGNPGFVTVLGSRRLTWPDYVGNSMYMTLGNLELAPACGLLFVDWAHGHALHLTGRARVDWDPTRAAAVPGAQRLVEFTVDRAVQIERASSLRWTFGEYFRHNPPTTEQMAEGLPA